MKKFAVTLAMVLLLAAGAHAQAPFYQGKTINIIVGTKAGDAYDLYPRMLAEFLPKHIEDTYFGVFSSFKFHINIECTVWCRVREDVN